jgi:Holliday junction resolvase
MANANKRKGDRAERELAALLTEALGVPVRRFLGAGRQDDRGDLDGVSNHTLQVKNWRDITAAIRVGMEQLKQQQANAGTDNSTLFIKHPRHGWLAVQTLEQWTKSNGGNNGQCDTGMGAPLR